MRLIVTGGGTGGHLFPGIAVACGMQRKFPETKILFIGTERLLDQRALDSYTFERTSIECFGLKGMTLTQRLHSLMQLPLAVLAAWRILDRFRPDLVFGVGGYVTGPVLLAAWLKRIPACIHEQNSIPGLANRLTARLAKSIFLSIPCPAGFPARKTILTGNPVRAEILEAATAERDKTPGRLTVLVLGGSQGAHRLNTLMLEAAPHLKEHFGQNLRIIHQTGEKDAPLVREGYRESGINAETRAFFSAMAPVYGQADLVISRAGATTLAEIAVMGLPAILIPFPYAADNHQEANGNHYVQGGGCLLFRENTLSGPALAGEIISLSSKPESLKAMADNMKKLAIPEATEKIIAASLQLCSNG